MEENAEAEADGQLDDLAVKISDNLRAAKSASGEWRTHARECYDFDAGRQWSDEDVAILEEQSRQPVVFNRVSRTINAVKGLEVANRQEVRFIPRELQDTGYNEMLTDASRWVRDSCNAEDEESESFGDLVICGMGWTETRIDYDEDPDGMILIDHVDPLGMFWDASATKKNLNDARWVARVKRMSKDDVQEMWPDYEGAEKADQWLDDDDDPHDASPPHYDNEEKNRNTHKEIEVVQYQWYERETFYRVQSPDGQIVEFGEERFEKLRDIIGGLPHVKQRRKVYRYAFMIGGRVYESGALAVNDGFTLRCMTGMRDRNKGTWFGLVSIMMDPQRWANKWLSQMMHIMNSNAKGGVMAEIDAFVDAREAQEEWAKPDAFIKLNPGGLNKVQEREQANFPAGFQQLMQYAVDSISDTAGVNMELMGLVGKEQPGVLESMRKQAGVTLLSVLFDALRLYRKEQGRILAAFIREYISDGRLIRIVGGHGARYVPLMRDSVSFKYDVIIDEAPTSHNQKEKVLSILMTLVPQMIQSGMPPPPPEVLEYLPIPESLMEKWLARTQPNPQAQQAQAQAAQEERQVALDEKRAKTMRDQAEAQKTAAEAAKIAHEAQAGGQNNDALVDMASEREKAQIKAASDIEVAKIRAVTQAQIERMKLGAALPDTAITKSLESIVGNTAQQMNEIRQALSSVSGAVVDAQRAVAELQKPKTRKVRFMRDDNGDIMDAEIIDEN